jgi:hypothetical protein
MDEDEDLVKKPIIQATNFKVTNLPKPSKDSQLVNKKTNWKAIRALQWAGLYDPLYLYLESGDEPKDKSKSGLYCIWKAETSRKTKASQVYTGSRR